MTRDVAARDDRHPEWVRLANNRSLACEVSGREHGGIPALLIRPLGGSMALWGPFSDVLSESLRVVAFDPAGVGDSSSEKLGATTRDMAADAIAVLDHFGIDKAHVFGLSLGGMVATRLAIEAPERVARLCLASVGSTGFDLSVAGLWHGVRLAASMLLPGKDVEPSLAREILSSEMLLEQPARVEWIASTVEANAAERSDLLKHGLAAALHDARGELGRIVAPTLVLAGDHDDLVGEGPARELAAGIAGARFAVIHNAGHDITLEQPLESARLVAAFFLETDG